MNDSPRVLIVGCKGVNTKALAKVMALSEINIQVAAVSMVDSVNEMMQLESVSEMTMGYINILGRDSALSEPFVNEHDNAQAPSFYINKNIQTVAPHKKQRRSKFKRR